MSEPKGRCLTCYGTGEIVTEQGPAACPDCFGDGSPLGRGAKLEWRLREIERLHRGSGNDSEPDILWLISELRLRQEALLRILTLCHDADESNTLAMDIKYKANEALALFDKFE
jgi:hypothetical protein